VHCASVQYPPTPWLCRAREGAATDPATSGGRGGAGTPAAEVEQAVQRAKASCNTNDPSQISPRQKPNFWTSGAQCLVVMKLGGVLGLQLIPAISELVSCAPALLVLGLTLVSDVSMCPSYMQACVLQLRSAVPYQLSTHTWQCAQGTCTLVALMVLEPSVLAMLLLVLVELAVAAAALVACYAQLFCLLPPLLPRVQAA